MAGRGWRPWGLAGTIGLVMCLGSAQGCAPLRLIAGASLSAVACFNPTVGIDAVGSSSGTQACLAAYEDCPCAAGGICLSGLACVDNVCVSDDGDGDGDGDDNRPPINALTVEERGPSAIVTGSVVDPDGNLAMLTIIWGDGNSSILDAGFDSIEEIHEYVTSGVYEVTTTFEDT